MIVYTYTRTIMNYIESVSWILSLTNYESSSREKGTSNNELSSDMRRIDLGRVKSVLEKLGNPHLGMLTVHIAGTKGKGSTAALISAVLTSSGYKVGLFTSPHLHSIRERVSLNSIPIDEKKFGEYTTAIQKPILEHNNNFPLDMITTFEVLTILAFYSFKSEGVDIQVIETGLGGRLDSTNVVDSDVVLITSISFDHTEILGDTLKEIAYEKAGIIKPGIPVISASQESSALEAIIDKSSELKSQLTIVGRDVYYSVISKTPSVQNFRVRGKFLGRPIDHELSTSLMGDYQLENAALAVLALEAIRDKGYPVPYDHILWGFRNVIWPGRFEVINKKSIIILDGAHNEYSAMRLVESIQEQFPNKQVEIVIGVSEDKDIGAIARELTSIGTGAFVTKSRHPKSMDTEQIADAFWETGLPVRPEPSVKIAMTKAILEVGEGGLVLVTGSLFIVAEAREFILDIEPELLN